MEEHTSASGRASSSISASSRRLSAVLGALSCTMSASPTASARGGERDRPADTGRKSRPTRARRSRACLVPAVPPPDRVGHDHVDPVLDETTRPAAADHTATDDCDASSACQPELLAHLGGPRTPFIASRIVTARSTSALFVAFAPARARCCPQARRGRCPRRAGRARRRAAACDRSRRRRDAFLRKLVDHGEQRRRVVRCAVGNTGRAEHRGLVDEALGEELLGENEVPVSKISISGRTPSAWICRAISRSIEGVFVIT